MRKIVYLLHITFDGYVAGPDGELNWAYLDEEMFDFVHELTQRSDAALYGRKTYEIMDAYWPTAAGRPDAGKHDREHAAWYNAVDKYVLSNSLTDDPEKKRHVLSGDVAGELQKLKSTEGSDILFLGSPGAWRSVMDLVDEYWFFVNPVILGHGLKLFPGNGEKHLLDFIETRQFGPVTALHYAKK